ncbi:unnamed protein product [Moneuplotes crassus]|uniref:Uncharacterized protein n=1 Tax=Euplotes crassus TaxID=5936 RepID=A0AAD1Y185_EUPCR|nr:unnamed protein product [Moneuplotes crassus]
MATLPAESIDEIAEQILDEIDDDEQGFFQIWFKHLRKMTIEKIIKGFMGGIGVFVGSLFCHHYVLPHLGLQFYSLFLVRLHKV